MSLELFDLGRRLRAHATGRPVPRMAYATCLPPTSAIAVEVTRAPRWLVRARTVTGQTAQAEGPSALTALRNLGVGLSNSHRTLIVADRQALRDLLRLAHTCAGQPELREVATTVAWWTQRAEHPGSGAIHIATEQARARWSLGTSPEAEFSLRAWQSWLRLPADTPTSLIALAAHTSAGGTLPGLLDAHTTDTYSWQRQLDQARRDWRTPDTRIEAALGLATRCDAAEHYASLLLDDPLVALRETYTGQVVTGAISHIAKPTTTITAQRPLSRLRPGTHVDGWAGDALSTERTGISATVVATTIDRSGHLHITIDQALRLPIGQTVTLRPRRVSAFQQARARRNARDRHRRQANWIAGRDVPPTRRREIPLDIVVAAADH